MRLFKPGCVASMLVLLSACGGSSDPDRGALAENPTTLTTLSVTQIDAATAASGLQGLSGAARCDVKFVALNYSTRGRPAK